MTAKSKLYLFSAKWCQPCQIMHKVYKKFEEAHPDLRTVHLDIDTRRGSRLADFFKVRSIPAFALVAKRHYMLDFGSRGPAAFEDWFKNSEAVLASNGGVPIRRARPVRPARKGRKS
jgi:thiol-disulfide isomerase/thioredoxin